MAQIFVLQILSAMVFMLRCSGYGCSTGLPTVGHTLADVRSVYDFLIKEHSVDPRSVVLYGQSVGSGPTVGIGLLE